MSNPITTAREAAWNYLYSQATEAATALKDYIDQNEGKVFRYASPADEMPVRLSAGDTPALILLPADAPPLAGGQLLHQLRLGLELRGAVAAADPAEIENFYWLVHRALYSGYPSLGEETIRLFYLDAVTFRGQGARGGSPWFWTFSARLVLHLRIDPGA